MPDSKWIPLVTIVGIITTLMFWNKQSTKGLSDLRLYRAHIRALQNRINHLEKRYYRAGDHEKYEIDGRINELMTKLSAARRAEEQR